MDGEKENSVQLLTGSNSPSGHGDPDPDASGRRGQDSNALPVTDGGAADPPGQVPGSCVEAPPDELRELSAKPRPRRGKRFQRVGLTFALALNTIPRKWPQSLRNP